MKRPYDLSCGMSGERLVEYLYETLAPEEREEARQHLASCAACQKTLAGLRRATRLLQVWTGEAPPVNLVFTRRANPAWNARLIDWALGRDWRGFAWGLVSGAAVAVLVFLGVAEFELGHEESAQALDAPTDGTAAVHPATLGDLARMQEQSLELSRELVRDTEVRLSQALDWRLREVELRWRKELALGEQHSAPENRPAAADQGGGKPATQVSERVPSPFGAVGGAGSKPDPEPIATAVHLPQQP